MLSRVSWSKIEIKSFWKSSRVDELKRTIILFFCLRRLKAVNRKTSNLTRGTPSLSQKLWSSIRRGGRAWEDQETETQLRISFNSAKSSWIFYKFWSISFKFTLYKAKRGNGCCSWGGHQAVPVFNGRGWASKVKLLVSLFSFFRLIFELLTFLSFLFCSFFFFLQKNIAVDEALKNTFKVSTFSFSSLICVCGCWEEKKGCQTKTEFKLWGVWLSYLWTQTLYWT